MPALLRKSIFIGVGGSGGTTLRYLYQELMSGLQERGWTDPMPACWQFLLIDVAQRPDGIRGDVPNVLTDEADYFGMAKAPADWNNFLRMLPATQPEAVAGWKPRSPLPGDPTLGAGQSRALGRLVAVTQLRAIADRIGTLNRNLGAADDELQRVATLLGVEPGLSKTASPHVYVVSSLGGGSGSGMFLDVSHVLKSLSIDHATVLYTPDVFDELTASGGNAGVVPNSMAAISELLAAFENDTDYSDADLAMLRTAGVQQSGSGPRTGSSHLIVGRKAEGWEFKQQGQVYHTTARALASVTLDGNLSEDIQNYVFQNLTSVPRSEEFAPLIVNRGPNTKLIEVVQSIGYAAVSTGRHAFGQYVAERLANFLVHQIVDGDEDNKKFIERENEAFLRQARHFAAQAGLLELGENDQILDAVRGGTRDVITSFTSAVRDQANTLLQKVNLAELSASEVDQQLDSNFKGKSGIAIADHKSQIAQRADRWTLGAQAALLNRVVTSISVSGLGLTIEYLNQMAIDLNTAVTELLSSSDDRAKVVPQLLQTAASGFSQLAKKVRLSIDAKPVVDGLEYRRKAMASSLESNVHKLTAELVADFVKNVVKPLTDALTAERVRFRNTMRNNDMNDRWTSLASGPTPIHLQPSANEFYLEEVESFKGVFEDKIADLFVGEGFEASLKRAAGEVLAGAWEGRGEKPKANKTLSTREPDFEAQGLIKVNSPWVTSVPGVATIETPSRGSYALHFDFDEILKTARTWQRERTGIAQYTQVSLYNYINDAAQPDHMEDFIQKLQLALAKAGCMIQIDMDALQEFTGGTWRELNMAVMIGDIPVDASDGATKLTPAAGRIVDDLMKFTPMPEPAARTKLVGKSPVSRVEIVTVTKERAHPVIFKSFTNPILQRWATVTVNPHFRNDFYSLRRSRTLPSFVPAAPSVLVNMVKGWMVARMLGYIPQSDIDAFKVRDGHGSIRIYDPKASAASGHYWSFPDAVLRGANPDEPLGDAEVLPALLESLILGYAGMGSGWLRAYARLAALGSAKNTELSQWITRGTVETPLDTTPSVGVVSGWADAAIPQDRLAKVQELIHHRRARVEQLINQTYDLDSILTAPRDWEIRRQTGEALDQLAKSIGVIESSPSPDEPGL